MLTSSLRAVLQVMEAIKPVSREITKETVKTIRAGNAGTNGCTCGDFAHVLLLLHVRLRVLSRRPAFPAPSQFRGTMFFTELGGDLSCGSTWSRHCGYSQRRPAVACCPTYGALGVLRSVLTRRRKQSGASFRGASETSEPGIHPACTKSGEVDSGFALLRAPE
jgi:hypothetical protein